MRLVLQMILLAVLHLLLITAGCSGPNKAVQMSPEDNPQHHYLTGMTALEQGKLAVAQEKFERAVFLDEGFSRGYSGLAITEAEKGRGEKDAGYREVQAGRSLDYLKKSRKYASSAEDEFDLSVATVRVHTALKTKQWLQQAEAACEAGEGLKVEPRNLIYYQGKEALPFFMATAYLEGLEFQKARDRFAQVLNAGREGKWQEKSDRGWKKTDNIVRAMAGITVGDVGKKIAVQENVSRADLAALLVDELRLDQLFAGRIPAASLEKRREAEFVPADMVNHPFRDEVLTLMKWRVRGLEPGYDEATRAYLFRATESVTRGEMALVMEDVLIKLTGNEKLATLYYGNDNSPFPDVRTTSPYYNAAMNMTSRGIMEAGGLSGEFRVAEQLQGAEALLAMRVLRQRINIY